MASRNIPRPQTRVMKAKKQGLKALKGLRRERGPEGPLFHGSSSSFVI